MTVDLEKAKGDGGATKVSAEELAELKRTIEDIRTDVGDDVRNRRKTARETHLAQWDGQSEDGRKHAEDLGHDAFPFEGASDNRVREADKIGGEYVGQLVTAAMRAGRRTRGVEGTDERKAGKVHTLLNWIIRNKWGAHWRRTVELLAQYQTHDTPAGAVCMVDWVQERCLQSREVTAQDLAESFFEFYADGQPTEEDAAELLDMLSNPARMEDRVAFLLSMVSTIAPARARKMAEEIGETGRTTFPMPYLKANEPQIAALRLFEDIFFRPNLVDMQRAPEVIHRRWLYKAEVLEQAGREGWSKAFLDELLGKDGEKGKEGKSALDMGNEDERVVSLSGEVEYHKSQYEVLTYYRRAANDDGAIGIYVCTMSAFCETAAREWELFDRRHGGYPFVYFSREILTSRLLDSRGVPEVMATDQKGLKLLRDSFEDHVQRVLDPPLKVPERWPRMDLRLGPQELVKVGPRDTLEWMKSPDYPAAATTYWRELRRAINEYFGRFDPEGDPEVVFIGKQMRVDRFLSSLADVLMITLQLCQQYMTPEMWQRVVGGAGAEVSGEVEEIQGKFDVQFAIDMRDMDMEYLLKKAKAALEFVRPLDTRATITFERIAQRILEALDPNWAEESIQPVEVATQREIREEKAALVQIFNGMRPEMPESGINATVRMQVMREEIGPRMQNPGAFQPLSPAALALLEEHRSYLEFQEQQYVQNPQTGRVGVDTRKTDEQIAEGRGVGGEGR